METVGTILYFIGAIGSLICLVMVLIKMFPAEGTLKGILAIICSLYAYVWGWMNAGRFNLQNVMYGWTGCIVLMILGALMGGLNFQAAAQGFDGNYFAQFASIVAASFAF